MKKIHKWNKNVFLNTFREKKIYAQTYLQVLKMFIPTT